MFLYCLWPRERFSASTMNEYRREWEYRMKKSRCLRQILRQHGHRRPKNVHQKSKETVMSHSN